MNKTYKFHISGMHCNACVLLTESDLGDLPNISKVKASLKDNDVEIIGNFGDKLPEQIVDELSLILEKHGYKLSVKKENRKIIWSDFKIAIPITIIFTIIFIFLQKIGLVNIIGGGRVTYGTAFIIGIVASLSSCMAVVGGLLLSMSATFAKEGDIIRPQILFHTGRVISFFILGGVIGLIGTAFTLNIFSTFAIGLFVGLVMLILGLNLLDIFPWVKNLQPSIPKFLSKHALGVSKLNHILTPFLVGIATFFLPCGFTQSMQVFSLTTGSFLKGGFTMLAFALGTLPVLALISFSSFSIKKSKRSGIFFKTAGLIVIMFALLNIINSLVFIGIIPPFLNL